MKYLLNSLLILSVIAMSTKVSAQTTEPKIAFEKVINDFGKIPENGGKVVAEFGFKNIGTKPLILQNVQASCGCTVPEYTNQPILPNEKGIIKATFDPSGRVGMIDKTITVTSNDPQKITLLRLKGEVVMKEPRIEDLYPFVWGDLRLSQSSVSMANIEAGKTKESTIEVYNANESAPMNLKFVAVPNHIKITTTPTSIAPKSKGTVTIVYDASKRNDWDYVTDWINVEVNGQKSDEQRIIVTAKIVEDFSSLTPEQKANAPVASFSEDVFDFGEIKEGNKVTHVFVVTNNGKSPLIIRKVQSSCGCTVVTPSKKVINPGEKAEIEATFDSKNRPGKVYKTITVVTNAPLNSNKSLTITGNVG